MAAFGRSNRRHIDKSETIRAAVKVLSGRITKAEIAALCPALSQTELDSGLKQLVSDGTVVRYGTGRSTFYIRTDELK